MRDTGADVAIVGMSGRFPGAEDVAALWAALLAGQDLITRFTRAELLAAGVSAAEVDDPSYVPARGVLVRPLAFDADFFGYSAREAELMDPQQRLLLEQVWRAGDDAGRLLSAETGRVGVFAAVAPLTYSFTAADVDPLERQLGTDPDFAATRIAYKLGLRGPAVTVAAACASGLAAVHLATQSLLAGESDVAVAAAASVRFPVDRGRHRQPRGILSADGRCRPFSAAADGIVEADGVAAVVLRPLDVALADGDRIHAVLLGSAMQNDGAQRIGFTAPSAAGQAATLRAALEFAGLVPADVDYVEAHGTGSRLGDPIEVRALAAAYGTAHRREPLRIGSVKSNLGHLNHVAGLVGLIKTALCLRHGRLVASINADVPNPELDLAGNGLALQNRSERWSSSTRRIAGVSSFGMGGTDVHVLVGEPPVPPRAAEERPYDEEHALVLSARTASALATMRSALADALEGAPSAPLHDVAATLRTGRTAFPHRAAVLARSAEEAVQRLRSGELAGTGAGRPVVFVFPGQGSQRAGMVAGLYGSQEVFTAELDRCLRVVTEEVPDVDALAVLLDPEHDVDLSQTRLAQPLLFAVEYACAKQWMAWGATPAAMLGHSVGEYVAACLAGVLDVTDAARITARRGALAQRTARGGMLSVGADEDRVQELLAEFGGLTFSAHNAPAECVVSGPHADLARFRERLAAARIPAAPVPVSHPFHSPGIEPAMPAFAAELGRYRLSAPTIAYVSGVTGDWITPEQVRSVDYWVRHMREPVRFAEAVATVRAGSDPVFLQAGPGRAAGGAARSAGADAVIFGMADGLGAERARALLWTAGAQADWPAPGPFRRQSLPGHPFQRQEFGGYSAVTPLPRPTRGRGPADWFYTLRWVEKVQPPVDLAATLRRLPERWAVVADPALVRLLAEGGKSVRFVGRVDPAMLDDQPHVVVVTCFADLLALGTALTTRPERPDVLVVTHDTLLGDAAADDDAAMASRAWRVVGQETRGLRVRHFDVDRHTTHAQLLAAVLREPDDELLLRRGRTLTRAVDPMPTRDLPAPPLRRGGTYLVTGGTGRIGRLLGDWLGRRHGARVVAIGRGTADVADRAALAAVWDRAGRVDGVIHAAGVGNTDASPLLGETGTVAGPFTAKQAGTRNLAHLAAERRPDFVLAVSSLSTMLGGPGCSGNAAANGCLEEIARAVDLDPVPWTVVRMDGWTGGSSLRRETADLISDEHADELFDLLFRLLGTPELAISTTDLARRAVVAGAQVEQTAQPDPTTRHHPRPDLAVPFREAANELEQVVADLLAELLRVDRVGADDDFFVLGGHSLLAIQLVARIEDEFGLSLSLRDVFDRPTPAALAVALTNLFQETGS